MSILFLIGCGGGGAQAPTQPPPGGGNRNPTVSINTSATHLAYGATATITVTASDPDGDQLTFSYTANGGAVSASGPTATTATFTAGSQWGSASVTVTVSDGQGGSTPATASMYIQNPSPPAFSCVPTTLGNCGSPSIPDGFILQITPPENVLIATIRIVPRDNPGSACGNTRNYSPTPLSLTAGQVYVWVDGGCRAPSCCSSQGYPSCQTWTIDIIGRRPEPDGGSFTYRCYDWDLSDPTGSCDF